MCSESELTAEFFPVTSTTVGISLEWSILLASSKLQSYLSKRTFKDLKKVKTIRNYVLKCNL